MAPGQPLFDLVLAFDQPVHRGVKLVFMGISNAQILRQRCIRESLRHRQLAGLQRDDAARDHRHHEIAFTRSLAIDQFLEAQPAHGDAYGLHMPMRQRADAFKATVRGRKLLTLEHEPDGLSLLQPQGRQVSNRPLLDALALLLALTARAASIPSV